MSTNGPEPPRNAAPPVEGEPAVALERVTFWLEIEQARKLREYARAHDRSLSNEGRRMVRLYLRELDRREVGPR